MNKHDTPAKVASTDGLGPVACATCGEQPYYTKAHIAAAVAAERERWETLLSAARRIAEGNAMRADDCGMLSRALLDALKMLRA